MPKRVLIVEDDPQVRKITCRMLERMGFEVIEAENGPAALSRIEETAPVDLVLCDVVMPGFSGMDLMLRLLERRPELRYVYFSGWQDHPAMAAADVPVLSKPFSPRELQDAVESALGAEVG